MKKQKALKDTDNQKVGLMFKEAIYAFTENIKALKEFYSALHPVVKEIDTKDEAKVKEMFENIIIESPKDKKKPIKLIVPNKAVYNKMLRLMKKGEFAKTRSFNTELLYQTIIINLCTYIENFVLEIGRSYYRLKARTKLDDMTLKFEEIKGLDSVDIAEMVIEKKLLSLGYDSFDDWIKFFSETIVLNIKPLIDRYCIELSEMFQRRHLYIHNAGKITTRYIENCDKKYLKKLDVDESKGAVIKTDKKYLDSCFSHVRVFTGILGQCVWYKFVKGHEDDKEREERELALSDYGFYFIEEGEYRTAQEYFKLAIDNFKVSDTIDFYMRANYWQSLKWQNKLTQTELNEINSIDLRNKDYLTKLAIYCLIDEKEKFFDVYPKAISTGDFKEDYLDWPIFKEMRTDARFKEISEKELKKLKDKKRKKRKQVKQPSKKNAVKKKVKKKFKKKAQE